MTNTRNLVRLGLAGVLVLGATAPLAAGGAACEAERKAALTSGLPGADAPAAIRIAAAAEPGAPLLVEGMVYAPDGVTPVPGVVVYAYHTDATGLYARAGGVPRLRGWMKTDARGHYEYRTVRPARYPGAKIPAHVHTQLWGAGYAPQWNKDLEFADDPFVLAPEKAASKAAGRFAWVCDPSISNAPGNAAQRCTHNLKLKVEGDTFEANSRHGFEHAPTAASMAMAAPAAASASTH